MMNNGKHQNAKLRFSVYDEEMDQKIFNGLFGPKEITKVLKKIKQKYG